VVDEVAEAVVANGDNCFHIWRGDEIVMTIRTWEGGLWYYDTSTQVALSLFTTKKDNMKNYTPRGVRQAELARRLQDIVMRPPSKKLKNILARELSGIAPWKAAMCDLRTTSMGGTLEQSMENGPSRGEAASCSFQNRS
jgi:hypothetical protein